MDTQMILPKKTALLLEIRLPGTWGTDVLVLTDEQKTALKALADKLIEG